jgi:hypothetical protein
MSFKSHQYVLVKELTMEIAAHSIVDESFLVLLLQPRLVAEDRVLVPSTVNVGSFTSSSMSNPHQPQADSPSRFPLPCSDRFLPASLETRD